MIILGMARAVKAGFSGGASLPLGLSNEKVKMTRRLREPIAISLPRNGPGAAIRSMTVESIRQQVAGAIDLKLHPRQPHWNVKGAGFLALHRLWDRVVAIVVQRLGTQIISELSLGLLQPAP
ncbi:MAG: hypothetical protein ACREOF_20620 [Gemmatimonadales bacterium]